jgi:ketosteroid isomerase-like protein
LPTKTTFIAKEALEELNVEKIMSIYAENAVFEDIPGGQRIMDKAALRAYFEELFSLPGVAFSDIRIFEGDNFAVIEWVWSGLQRDTGETYRVRGASVVELWKGKIIRESLYYDPRSALSENH